MNFRLNKGTFKYDMTFQGILLKLSECRHMGEGLVKIII